MFKFDKQFLFFLMQNVFIGICGMIDTSFSNHINVDSICVFSAYTVITWTTYCTYSIGMYAYCVVLDKSKMCFFIQMVVSIILSVLLYIFSSVIPHLYSLTNSQYALFEKCLKVHALSCPILAFREFLGGYAEYRCCNKQALTGNIILYSSMILTDALTVYFGGDLSWLLIMTGLCSLLYSVYEFAVLDFRKKPFLFSWSDIKILLKHGGNTYVNRITGKIATIFYNIYASKLGTELYSIHAVCYAIGIFTENFTNALFTFIIISSASKPQGCNKLQYCITVTRKYGMFIVITSYVTCYILLLFTHGAVDIKDCIIWTALYSTEVFGLLIYEPMQAYLTSECQTGYLRFGGMIGIFVRIPAVLLGYHLNLGLVSFAFSCMLDFAIRGLYYYSVSKRINGMNKLRV